jgi:hypothetical protein
MKGRVNQGSSDETGFVGCSPSGIRRGVVEPVQAESAFTNGNFFLKRNFSGTSFSLMVFVNDILTSGCLYDVTRSPFEGKRTNSPWRNDSGLCPFPSLALVHHNTGCFETVTRA